MKQSNFMPIEKYYGLKSIFERLWGKNTYLDLKHCSNLNVWKKYAERTLSASKLAFQATITVKDEDWKKIADDIIADRIESIKRSTSFDNLFESLAAAYIELSFHQIGFMPSRPPDFRAQLRTDHWKLDKYRTAQYVQNTEQKRAVSNRNERKKISGRKT